MVPCDASGVAQCGIVYKGYTSIHVDVPILWHCRGSFFFPQSLWHCSTTYGFINEIFFLAAMQLQCLGERERLEEDPSKLSFSSMPRYTVLYYHQNRAWWSGYPSEFIITTTTNSFPHSHLHKHSPPSRTVVQGSHVLMWTLSTAETPISRIVNNIIVLHDHTDCTISQIAISISTPSPNLSLSLSPHSERT